MKKIKDVTKLSGLSRRTLQYYDEKGLLNVERTGENYRLYSEEDLQKLWEILVYKEMGFSLDGIKELMQLDGSGAAISLDLKLYDLKEQIKEHEKTCRFIEQVLLRGIPKYNDLGAGTFKEHVKRLKEEL